MNTRFIAHIIFRHRLKFLVSAVFPLFLGAWGVLENPELPSAEAVLSTASSPDAFAALLASPDLTGIKANVTVDQGGVIRISLKGGDSIHSLEDLLNSARQRRASASRQTHRAALQAESAAADAEVATLVESLNSLEAQRNTIPATIQLTNDTEQPRVLEEARSKLFELQTKEGELLTKYQPSSPIVQAVQNERNQTEVMIRQLDAPLQARSRSGINPIRQSLDLETMKTITALASARAKARNMGQRLMEFDKAGSDDVTVIERPHLQSKGLSPLIIMAGAAVFGLSFALIVAALAEHWSVRFSTPSEVENALGLSVLTSIPRED